MLIKFEDNSVERRVDMIDGGIKTQKGLDRLWNRIEIRHWNGTRINVKSSVWVDKKVHCSRSSGRKQLSKNSPMRIQDILLTVTMIEAPKMKSLLTKLRQYEAEVVERGRGWRHSLEFLCAGQGVLLPGWNSLRRILMNQSSTRGSSQDDSAS